ncbi:lysophospholipase [Mycena leptocephala]|nr:lysophospholipase [Mycena leptocephala]
MFRFVAALVLLVLLGLARASFGPTLQRCPADFQLVRRGQTISESEARYIAQKRENVLPGAFKTYLQSLPKYVEQILESKTRLPTVGISTSGGGYRAALFGAGVLNALDARNVSSVQKGTGGLLQAATHLAGLSGGSWLLTSLAQANLPTIQHLIFGDGKTKDFAGWIPSFSLWTVSADPAEQAIFAQEVLQEFAVKAKHFPVSVGDAWGRALARHFTNGTTLATLFANTSHGAGILFSDLVNLPAFASHEHPFPVIVANLASKHINGRFSLAAMVSSHSTPPFPSPRAHPVLMRNAVEMGCYDDVLAAHTPLKHLGTTNHSLCVTGFDEAMFISGTSSNLSANFSILINETYPQSPALRLDTSNYPNPFHGVAPETFADSGETILALIDGGEDAQVTPLQPMLVEDRKSTSSSRSTGCLSETPDNFALEPTSRPTFFGCTPSSSSSKAPGPLLVYIANGAPPRDGSPPLTNTSLGQLTFTDDEMQGMLKQTFDIATQGAVVGGALEDEEWGACLACAVVDRARARENVARSGVCTTCFARYCWEG